MAFLLDLIFDFVEWFQEFWNPKYWSTPFYLEKLQKPAERTHTVRIFGFKVYVLYHNYTKDDD